MKHIVLHSSEYFESDEEIRIFPEKITGHHEAHAHDFIEIVYAAAGAGTQTIGGCKENMVKGDLFLINSNVVHEFESIKGGALTIYNCIFEPLYVDSSFRNCKSFVDVAYQYTLHTMHEDDHKDYIKLSGLQHGKIETMLFEMYSELREKQGGYRHILHADLIKLLIYIYRVYKNDNSQKQNDDVYKKLIVQNSITYLKGHYTEDIKCEQLSRRSYMSLSYFNKIFKEISGMTVIEMLQNIRINVACDMLENTKKPIGEIALETGYSDKKFFYELFKRKKEISPGEYRKKYKKI